ncbi:MAG: hypothetical protein BWX95_02576 [Bacteroidetes bacterium ADurb.Bin141]|nr:MAG: hypothetical protein BWX95_02576 [Bacteroidetes bacterium ADurb.Bin141]
MAPVALVLKVYGPSVGFGHTLVGAPVIGSGWEGTSPTVIVVVLFTLMELSQPASVKCVTVISQFPAEVRPVAVNVPVPAVVTVIEAVNPVAAGKLLS